jgi:transposase
VLYTVLESAKLNELNPEAYLADVTDRMARGHPINQLSKLLPWNWKPKETERVNANAVIG